MFTNKEIDWNELIGKKIIFQEDSTCSTPLKDGVVAIVLENTVLIKKQWYRKDKVGILDIIYT